MDSNFNSAAKRLFLSFSEFRERVERELRQDWSRSKEDAKDALLEVNQNVRAVAKTSSEAMNELKIEFGAALTKGHAYLISDAFEAKLDELIRSSGKQDQFEKEIEKEPIGSTDHPTWFASVHGSLFEDPFENIDSDGKRDRRERVGRKLGFLLKQHEEGMIAATAAGAFVGSIFGPQTAFKGGLVGGGLWLAWILTEAAQTLLFNEGEGNRTFWESNGNPEPKT
jgi:hypothetical protein